MNNLKLCSNCGKIMGFNSWFQAFYCTSCGQLDEHINNIIKCPRCGSEVKVVRETNFDNLETYLYPVCNNCKWTTKEVFRNEIQILEHIKMKF